MAQATYTLEGIGTFELDPAAVANTPREGAEGLVVIEDVNGTPLTANGTNIVFKLYKDDPTLSPAENDQLRALRESSVTDLIDLNIPDQSVCAPLNRIYDADGKFAGFAMRAAEGSLANSLDAFDRDDIQLDTDKTLLALDHAKGSLEALIARDVLLVDFNRKGFFYNTANGIATGETTLIDLDGSDRPNHPAPAIMVENRDPRLEANNPPRADAGAVWYSFACTALEELVQYPPFGGTVTGYQDNDIERRKADKLSILDGRVDIDEDARETINQLRQDHPQFMQWIESVLNGDVRTPPPPFVASPYVAPQAAARPPSQQPPVQQPPVQQPPAQQPPVQQPPAQQPPVQQPPVQRNNNTRTSWLRRTRNNNQPAPTQNQADNSSYLWAGLAGAAAAGTAYSAINTQKEETQEARYNHAVFGNQAPKPDRSKSTFKVVLSVALCATALYLGVQTQQSRSR